MRRLCAQLFLLALLYSLVLSLLVSRLTICSYNSYQELYRAFIPLTQSYTNRSRQRWERPPARSHFSLAVGHADDARRNGCHRQVLFVIAHAHVPYLPHAESYEEELDNTGTIHR